MKFAHAACAAVCTSLLLAVGCGSGDDLFSEGRPLDGAGGDTSTESGNTTSTSSSPTTDVATTSTNSGGASPTTTTAAGGNPGVGGSGTGANPGAMLDCGSGLTCPVGQNSACCWDQYEQEGDPQAECVTGGIDGDGCITGYDEPAGLETRIECQNEDHCGGDNVCCARLAFSTQLQSNVYVTLTCADYDDCIDPPNGEYRGLVVCDMPGSTDGCPMIPVGGGQMVQSVCKDSQLLPDGYLICGNPNNG